MPWNKENRQSNSVYNAPWACAYRMYVIEPVPREREPSGLCIRFKHGTPTSIAIYIVMHGPRVMIVSE